MKTKNVFRLILFLFLISFTVYGVSVYASNPNPEYCVCDNEQCSTATCSFYSGQYCQYKYYPIIGWYFLTGDPDCPSRPYPDR